MGFRDFQSVHLGAVRIVAAYRNGSRFYEENSITAVAPTFVSAPVLAGGTAEGQSVSVTPGVYAGTPTPAVTRQWLRNGTAIGGATGLFHALTEADVGALITLRETATNSAGSVQAVSAAIGPVSAAVPAAPTGSTAPSISGSATVGLTLTATEGTWTGAPTVTLQWLRNGAAISGATGATHELSAADLGAEIRVTATATNAGGSASMTSAAVGPVTMAGNTTPGIIANRFQVPTGNLAVSTAPYTSRRHHYASGAGDVSDIRCVDTGWYMNGSGPQSGASRTLKRFIEYPAGTFHPVTWSGAETVTLSGTGSQTSDIVLSALTGVALEIPAGEKFWERTVVTTTGNVPCIVLPATNSALATGDGNASGDLGNSGTIGQSGISQTIGAAAMTGTIHAVAARSVVFYGDSIAYGQGDTSGIGSKGGTGWLARWFDLDSTPYVKIAYPGYMAQTAASNTAAITSFLAALYFSDFISELGVNDTTNGRTVAQVSGNLGTILNLPGAARKPARIWQTTLTPRSSSTNSYTSVAGQSPKVDGTTSLHPVINRLIRTGAIPNQTGFIDAADAAMSARDSGVWSGPFPPVSDGTHPLSAKAAALAAAVSFKDRFENYAYPAPGIVIAPAISGTIAVGEVLDIATGNWWNAPASYSYQWNRDGAAIPGATSASYRIVSADAGAILTVTITATNEGGSGTATTAGVGPVASTGAWEVGTGDGAITINASPASPAAPSITATGDRTITLSA